jgi:hypothetical protein
VISFSAVSLNPIYAPLSSAAWNTVGCIFELCHRNADGTSRRRGVSEKYSECCGGGLWCASCDDLLTASFWGFVMLPVREPGATAPRRAPVAQLWQGRRSLW